MKLVESPADWGAEIRKKRKALGIKQAELAGLSGVGLRFVSELERGKPTCELGKAIRVALRLGLVISLKSRNELRVEESR